MNIKFLGAAGTVTGSSYILTSGSGRSIAIDLGMFQGTEDIEKLNYEEYQYDCSKLSGAILTHAHLDHCGRLPLLLKKGYKGKIWMTRPTADLASLSLLDTAKIAKQEDKPVLFDKNFAFKTIAMFSKTDYHQKIQVGDFNVTFFDAGHLLGSASLLIEDTKASSEIKKIIFSGDLGNSPDSLLHPLETIDVADAVVMESTYGDRLHPDEDPNTALANELNAISLSRGTLLIPAFSLDRTQEILHRIKHLKADGIVPTDLEVYLDGPMAQKATDIYLKYFDIFNNHIQNDLKNNNPFTFPGLKVVMSHQESVALRESAGAKVIIAGSGMMSGGRIVSHAASFLSDPKSRLFIVGYQGEETLGREILEGAKEVLIDDDYVSINANVNHTQAMSSHADQGQLIEWLSEIKDVKKIFLTHGEDAPRKVLSEKIREKRQINDIYLPKLNEEIRF